MSAPAGSDGKMFLVHSAAGRPRGKIFGLYWKRSSTSMTVELRSRGLIPIRGRMPVKMSSKQAFHWHGAVWMRNFGVFHRGENVSIWLPTSLVLMPHRFYLTH